MKTTMREGPIARAASVEGDMLPMVSPIDEAVRVCSARALMKLRKRFWPHWGRGRGEGKGG
jgi:hypothetical protein